MFLVPNLPHSNALSHSASQSGRFLASLLGYPSSCMYNNALHSCTFSFTCWLVGGQLHKGCSEAGGGLDVMADLLFTCCVPATRSVAAVYHPPPTRREDIDHRNNEIIGSTKIVHGIGRGTGTEHEALLTAA
uniref:Uncharacterized protein n=1 Tax=Timema monikensis TaxID=170555 RepID=A0A7R9EI79_9NEOP|nr:unnamed protein product [Timema monikensis]